MTLNDVLTIVERVLDEELRPAAPLTALIDAYRPLDPTREHMQLNALKGEIRDADGASLFTLAPLMTPEQWDAFLARARRRK